MITIILIMAGLLAGAVALVLASEGFAYEVSRAVEAAFDAVEIRLERRAERRAEMAGGATVGEVSVRAVASYARAGATAVTGPLSAAR